MTPDERTLLTRYLNDLTQVRNVAKDPEAAALISQALASNPDAFYLLVQHAIIADHSLQMAEERIHGLESQLAAQQSAAQPQSSSFLGAAMTGGPWGRSAQAAEAPAYNAPAQAPAQSYAAPSAFPPVQSQPSGFSSFLRNAGTTAMGVVAGQALFSGVESLFGGRGGFGGQGLFGGQSAFGGFGSQGAFNPGETVIVNNYNTDDSGNDDTYDVSDDLSDDSSYDDNTV